jgi:hypothetical protein
LVLSVPLSRFTSRVGGGSAFYGVATRSREYMLMKALRDLYKRHLGLFADFVHSFPSEDLQGPLLMEPLAYFQQRIRLFIIGQETGGWHYAYDDIEAQLEIYRKFNLGDKWRGPFWNITRKVEAILGVERCSCAWSNLNRFDHGGRAPTGKTLGEVSKFDFLVREEIQILKPDICLFYTNRKYDSRIEGLFPGVQFHNIDGLPEGHFTRLNHADLPKLTFRTPHPRAIRMSKQEAPFLAFIRSISG